LESNAGVRAEPAIGLRKWEPMPARAQKMGAADALWDLLDGIFACVVHDGRTGEFCAARDALGVCPLYWGRSADGATWFCSELKGLQAQCEHFDIFPPVRPAAPALAGLGTCARQ